MNGVDEYLKANAEFEAAKRDLAAFAKILADVAGVLNRTPEGLSFANSGVGLPMDIALSSSTVSIDAGVWPTPEKIQTAIARRFTAKRAVQTAWSAVPREMQASLVAPKF